MHVPGSQLCWELNLDRDSFRVVPVRKDRRCRFASALGSSSNRVVTGAGTPSASGTPTHSSASSSQSSASAAAAAPAQEAQAAELSTLASAVPASTTEEKDKTESKGDAKSSAAAETKSDSVPAAAAAPASASSFEYLETYSLDLAGLRHEIEQDLAAGRLPCAVWATMGPEVRFATLFWTLSPHIRCGSQQDGDTAYDFDNLWSLRAFCDQHVMWLHAEGAAMFAVAAADSFPQAAARSHSAAAHGAHSSASSSDSAPLRQEQPVACLLDCVDSTVCEPLRWFNAPGQLGVALLNPIRLAPVVQVVRWHCSALVARSRLTHTLF